MQWFRSNIRHGTRAALLALAIQFVLSFSHFHGVTALAAPALSSHDQHPPASNPDSDRNPHDSCAICAVMALANTLLVVSPPVLLLPQAIEFLYVIVDAEFVHLNSADIAFRPRAPPFS